MWGLKLDMEKVVKICNLKKKIVYLQCFVNFCGTAEWFSYTCEYVFFNILFHFSLPQDFEHISLCCTVGPWCLPLLYVIACAYALSLSCAWLCECMDCSLRGSPIHGILQARILERVAMPLSRGPSHLLDLGIGSSVSGALAGGVESLPLSSLQSPIQ